MVRFRRYAGQAQNAFNANGLQNALNGFNAQGMAVVDTANDTLMDEMLANTDEGLAEAQVVGQVPANVMTGIDINRDGTEDQMVFVQLEGQNGVPGAEALLRVPQAQAPAPAPPVQDECVFNAQSVELERNIVISTSAPRIVNAETDVCGNLLGYTERIVRTMNASNWVPVSGTDGPLAQVQVDDNGEVFFNDNPGADLANSRGFDDINFQYTNTGQPSIGSRYPNGVNAGGVFAGRRRQVNYNKNAAAMAGALRSYRGA